MTINKYRTFTPNAVHACPSGGLGCVTCNKTIDICLIVFFLVPETPAVSESSRDFCFNVGVMKLWMQ